MNETKVAKPIRMVAALLLAVLTLSVFAPMASAADRIENLSTSYPRTYYTAAIGQGSPGGTLTLGTSNTKNHTVSGSIGISVSVVSASIGYSYSSSQSITYTYSRSAPLSSRCYRINAYDNFRRDSFKWIKDNTWAPDTTGNATTQNHLSVSYTTSDYAKPSSGC